MRRTIITISRETGSGGHTIGYMLAERLGYAFYDGAIIEKVSEEFEIPATTEGEFMDTQTAYELIIDAIERAEGGTHNA